MPAALWVEWSTLTANGRGRTLIGRAGDVGGGAAFGPHGEGGGAGLGCGAGFAFAGGFAADEAAEAAEGDGVGVLFAGEFHRRGGTGAEGFLFHGFFLWVHH